MKNVGIILSGGIGTRMECKVPKQYLKVLGKEIIQYSIEAFKAVKDLDYFFVVVDSDEHAKYLNKKYGVETILGGSTRNESFANALNYIHNVGGCKNIFINEAARPMITTEIISDFLSLIENNDCVYCIKDVTDSLEYFDGTYADRSKYNLVMSPEAYKFEMIYRYFNKNSETTFPGHTLPTKCKKIRYTKYSKNIKVTYKEDIVKLTSMLENLE